MDIVIIIDSFWTLANKVITNSTRIDLVQCALIMTTHVMTIATQDKAWSYIEQMPWIDFIPLTIETYNCFHPCFDSFLTFCVDAYIVHHQQTSLVPLIFISHYRQWVLIALQCALVIAIIQRVAMFSHNFASLPHIPIHAPPSLSNLWHRMPF